MKNLTDIYIEKSQRTGRYADTAENRRLHRVGQPYKKREAEATSEEMINSSKKTGKVKSASEYYADFPQPVTQQDKEEFQQIFAAYENLQAVRREIAAAEKRGKRPSDKTLDIERYRSRRLDGLENAYLERKEEEELEGKNDVVRVTEIDGAPEDGNVLEREIKERDVAESKELQSKKRYLKKIEDELYKYQYVQKHGIIRYATLVGNTKREIEKLTKKLSPESLIKYENLPTKVDDMGRIFSQRAIKPFIYTDNGNADLNREGKKGFTTWVGFEHVTRGRQPVDKSKMLQYISAHAKKDFVRAVNEKTGGNFTESDVKLDDRWDSTDMFRMYIDTSKLSDKTGEASAKQPQAAKTLPKQDNSLPTKGASPKKAVENFTRVKFDDMPNSSKVNLKKYLSTKLKADVDTRVAEATKDASKAELERLNTQSTKTFNDAFDVMPKSGRAAQLYYIMKVRDLLARK